MIIRAEGLTKRYGHRVGVEDLSLEVASGSLFGFIGPNGAGKTTTIRLLLGLLRPQGGRATILGYDCWRSSRAIKKQVGYVPGDLRLHSWMTGRAALGIAAAARGADLVGPGLELGEYFGLDLEVRVRSMSRGMRQKLGLILALAHGPELLILDEPTSSLDPLTQDQLYVLLRDRAQRGTTVFFSSHVLSEVEDLCDRVAIIRRGRLVAHEALSELRTRAQRSVTLRWSDGESVGEPPSFLDVYERKSSVWNCGLGASTPDLLAWLHDKPVADVTIGAPDLDSLFRRYYEDEPETRKPS